MLKNITESQYTQAICYRTFTKGMIPVKLGLEFSQATEESLIAAFFRESEGKWRSERRYYTLPAGDTIEGLSFITNRFLVQGSAELLHLAELHHLSDINALTCGAYVTWESIDPATGRQRSVGETVFGALGTTLYRDRGFATPKPVTAEYYLPNPQTLCLRTEYSDSVFEEELKLIGHSYRTRQTISSRAGEQLLIAQYLEKRIQ